MSTTHEPVDLAEQERRLAEMRDDLQRRLGRFTATPERGSALGFGKRVGDGTIEAVDRLNQIGIGGQLEARLERVERALDKLAEGTYGTCDVCAQPIDPRRLRAAPQSTTCVSCPAPR